VAAELNGNYFSCQQQFKNKNVGILMPLKKAHPLSTYVDLPNLSPLYVCRSGLNLLQRRDNENMHLLAITAKYMSA
jgi:hypothetical protein